MDFIVSTLVRLLGGAMLGATLLGFVLVFNLVSRYVFSGSSVDIDFSLGQYVAAWGVMYLLTFIFDPS